MLEDSSAGAESLLLNRPLLPDDEDDDFFGGSGSEAADEAELSSLLWEGLTLSIKIYHFVNMIYHKFENFWKNHTKIKPILKNKLYN